MPDQAEIAVADEYNSVLLPFTTSTTFNHNGYYLTKQGFAYDNRRAADHQPGGSDILFSTISAVKNRISRDLQSG